DLRTNGQRGLIRVVQPAIQITAGFLYSPGKKTPVCIVDIQNLIPEKIHHGTVGGKRYNDEAGSGPFSGFDPVELSRLMKSNLPSCKDKRTVSGSDSHISFIYTNKFPEGMRLSRKIKAVHIFKIME